MTFDIFFSICQTPVDGHTPNEKTMWSNFFEQVRLADELGYQTAWVAETHLSCQVQKKTSFAVIPEFQGEIGLNTDILQLAHAVFAQTKHIHVGSAIRNILTNGGPIFQAESLKTFLSLQAQTPWADRRLNLGFASGRFEFSNRPFGIKPRSRLEEAAWPALKGKILHQATELFLRLLDNEHLTHLDLTPITLRETDFRSPEDWQKVRQPFLDSSNDKNSLQNKARLEAQDSIEVIHVDSFYDFEKIGVIPFEAPMTQLDLTLGSHDPALQIKANQYRPVGVFNLSITPPKVIEETHARMKQHFHPDGGPWTRAHMPRTAMVFLNADDRLTAGEQTKQATQEATKAWQNYWRAMEGTLDSKKVEQAVHNALVGNAEEIAQQIIEKYHPEDRLMLWFDFNNHNSKAVCQMQSWFMQKVRPLLDHNWSPLST